MKQASDQEVPRLPPFKSHPDAAADSTGRSLASDSGCGVSRFDKDKINGVYSRVQTCQRIENITL
jgi:hypothetical protein